ncbi:tyrosine-type recombinase/integrase [Azospirillum sp. B510]|uniref:tyrosine-type recombinase/integrase n=1 Tax=Azospirillum sp. (strain B510) TaxID=137722 RepID=UPI001305428F|nr:hypothetical protein [Azospirillum sp. B510]
MPYLIEKRGSAGPLWFWQPSTELRKAGWRSERLRHSDGRPAATLDEAVELAKLRNAELAAWRKGATTGTAAPAAPPMPDEVRPGSVAHIIRLYKASARFTTKAEKTRYEYGQLLKVIEAWSGDAPVKALSRETVQDYYQSLWDTGKKAKANAVLRVLRILLKFAWDNGHVTHNAAEKPGMVSIAPRLRIWSDEEIDRFVAAADAAGWPCIADAVVYGVYLGQRQGDLLALRQLAVQPDGTGYSIHLKQAKRGARVAIPLHPRAAARQRAALARRTEGGVKAVTALWNDSTKAPWSADTFRHQFSEIRATVAKELPSIADVWFMDTRDTAVTKLAEAGCTVPEICAITGHDEPSAYQILKHYLSLTGEMAAAAIAKLVAHEEAKKAKAERTAN